MKILFILTHSSVTNGIFYPSFANLMNKSHDSSTRHIKRTMSDNEPWHTIRGNVKPKSHPLDILWNKWKENRTIQPHKSNWNKKFQFYSIILHKCSAWLLSYVWHNYHCIPSSNINSSANTTEHTHTHKK